MTRISVLGAGALGESLLAGLLRAGVESSRLAFTVRREDRATELTARLGVRCLETTEAVARADVVVIAVKPKDVFSLLPEIRKALSPGTVVVSLCAGITTEAIERELPDHTAVVRVMTNTPLSIGEAASAISRGRFASHDDMAAAARMMGAVGRVVEVPESQQASATALSGSGPAYIYLIVEALVDAAVALGLPRDTATALAVQSAYGAAAMLRETPDGPAGLRENVTSPAGTTGAAIRELERHGIRAAFFDALKAAEQRSNELGRSVSN